MKGEGHVLQPSQRLPLIRSFAFCFLHLLEKIYSMDFKNKERMQDMQDNIGNIQLIEETGCRWKPHCQRGEEKGKKNILSTDAKGTAPCKVLLSAAARTFVYLPPSHIQQKALDLSWSSLGISELVVSWQGNSV